MRLFVCACACGCGRVRFKAETEDKTNLIQGCLFKVLSSAVETLSRLCNNTIFTSDIFLGVQTVARGKEKSK